MAEESKIVISVEVAGVERQLKTLKDIKQARKDLTEASVFGDKQAAKALADLNDKLEDVGDSVKTLKGSGVEKISGSFGQLGEGFKNLDLDKIKTGFKGLGSAMAAIPIFLIVEGITYLISNFKELSQGNGILAKSLRVVGDVMEWIVDKVYALTDALGLTNSELDKQGEAIKENAEKSKEALDAQTAAFDRQIKAAQAAGKSTVELEKAKQQAIIDTNRLIAEQIANFVRAGGELDDEKKKQLTAALETIKNAVNDQQVVEIKADEDKKKRNAEAAKKRKEEIDKSKEDADALFEQLSKQQDEADKKEADRKQKEYDDRQKNLEDLKALQLKADQEAVADFIANENALKAEKDRVAAEDLARKEKLEANKKALEETSVKAALALSDLFFTIQSNKAGADEKKQLEIKKRMFQVDKAFKVVQTVQDGIAGVQSQLKAGPIVGPILAGLVAVTAAANVAKILATKFDGGTASAGDVGGGGSASLPSSSTPTLNTTAPTTQASTTFDEQGRNQNFNRVYVVESDITKSQGRVAKLAEQATI